MSRIHFDVTHPAHVHLFRHAIRDLADAGHGVVVTSRRKEITTDLLDAYGIPHTVLSTMGERKTGLLSEWGLRGARMVRYDWRYKPDVIVSRVSPTAVAAAAATGAKSVVFHDHEGTTRMTKALLPFIDRLCTSTTFRTDYGTPHRRHDGVQELAYLHPNRFEADRDRLREHGVEPDEPYAVLRFVSMGAHHDVGLEGLSPDAKRRLVDELSAFGPVYVSAEDGISTDLSAEPVPVPPAAIHDLLAEAGAVVTDSNTMATEAGLLGTPTVRSGSYTSTEFSNFEVLGEAGIVESYGDEGRAVDRAVELAGDPDAPDRWERKRDAYLEGADDVTEFMVDTILEVASE